MKLPDVLAPKLKVVFVGTAAGNASVASGQYYAGRGNKFWRQLFKLKLIRNPSVPQDIYDLLKLGIGLTDLAKRAQGADSGLDRGDFDTIGFLKKMSKLQPGLIAFNGKRAYRELGHRKFDYGLQPHLLAKKHKVVVLPSTSGSANRYWDERFWRALPGLMSEEMARRVAHN